MGGCGFWFLLYMLLVCWLGMTLQLENVWAFLPICILCMFLVAFLRALIIAAFNSTTGFGVVFRVAVVVLFFALLATGHTGWMIALFVLYSFLELVVAFS